MAEAVLKGIMAPTQGEVAIMYAEAIRRERSAIFGLEVDWPAVNKAIVDRWSMAGLKRVKALAWKELENEGGRKDA